MWPFSRAKARSETPTAPNRPAFFPTYGSMWPAWMERSPEAFAREGYIANALGFACVTKKARAVASVRLQLEKVSPNGTVDLIEDHAILKLLQRPNPMTPGPLLIEALVAFKLIAGNAYLTRLPMTDAARQPKGGPSELWLLRPDRVTVLGGDGLPTAYRYKVGDVQRDYPVNLLTGFSDVLQLRTFHPLSDWYGLSPMEAAAYSIDTFNKAQTWNKALLDNGARPSGAMVMTGKDGAQTTLSEEQFTRLREQIDSQYSGPGNAGYPMLLEGGMDWREMSMNPKDMDYVEGLWANARLIALAHDVPPQLLGIPGDSTFANFEQAQLSFWENTVLPELDSLLEYLNGWLVPQYGEPGLRLAYDEDSIRALEPRRQIMFDRAAKATWLTVDEKRVMSGFDELPNGEGKVILVPTGQIPLDMAGADLNEPPAPATDDPAPDTQS